jgi:hypothetical protein
MTRGKVLFCQNKCCVHLGLLEYSIKNVRFDVLAAVTKKSAILLSVTGFRPVRGSLTLLLECCFAWFTFRPWKWRQYVPQNCRRTSAKTHGVASQKRVPFINIHSECRTAIPLSRGRPNTGRGQHCLPNSASNATGPSQSGPPRGTWTFSEKRRKVGR